MEITWFTTASWAGVCLAAITLAAWLLVRRARKSDASDAERKAHRAQYEKTLGEWSEAIQAGKIARAMRLRRRLAAMRAAGWFALVLLLAGCAAPKTEVVATLPTGEHILLPLPGDTVPPLPDGEPRWWLCTPSGLRMLLPDESLLLLETPPE